MRTPPDKALPTGTLTFMFTDIEGSTKLAHALGTERFHEVLDLHGRALRQTFDRAGGRFVRSEGDAFFYVFVKPTEAVAGAADAQRALVATKFPHGAEVRVRMGLHTGEATVGTVESGVDYVGYEVHHAARVSSSGHGGQVLLSETTAALVRDALPPSVSLRDLGEHRFKDLSRPERVHQLTIDGLPADFPPLRALDAPVRRLPVQVTSFVGRDREVALGSRLLGTSRILTLTGPGGTGKTRLSLQIAARFERDFHGGVTFVPLSAIQDPAHVAPAIAHALALDDSAGMRHEERIVAWLAPRKALLVLDNFEQILPAASVVAELVQRCPDLKVLVSSRAALHIYGEQEMPVPPLSLPDPKNARSAEAVTQYEAVRLFIDRAVAIRPGFRVTNENAPAVAAICARLDGLPLAIELAAARVRLLSPQQILARLEDRLGLLQSGSRDLPARQQTLRGAIAWSYDLLDAPSRALFQRFAVFAGGATVDDAESVCGPGLGADVLDVLSVLVDHSLVRRDDAASEPRMQMLETIREYALERLATDPERVEIERRHTARYLALVEEADRYLLGRERNLWLTRLDTEHENLRVAVTRTIASGDAQCALRLTATLWRYWQIRGHLTEGRRHVDRALALPTASRFPRELELAHAAAGSLAYWNGDMPKAGEHYRDGAMLARANGDVARLSAALYNLSFVGWGDRAGAELPPGARMWNQERKDLVDEALALARQVGDRILIGRAQWAAAMLEGERNDLVKALEIISPAIETFREIGAQFDLSWALQGVGLSSLRMGELEKARAALREQISLLFETRDLAGVSVALGDHLELAIAEGRRDKAITLAGAAAGFRHALGGGLTDFTNLVNERKLEITEADKPKWDAGFTMTLDDAVAFALKG